MGGGQEALLRRKCQHGLACTDTGKTIVTFTVSILIVCPLSEVIYRHVLKLFIHDLAVSEVSH